MTDALDIISALPRVPLMSVPTPLEPLPELSARLGMTVLAKRDDLTGIGGGGNKLRKLEFLVGDACRDGADTLITTGGVQSNHARLTAAAAARCGLACELMLKGPQPERMNGNLRLNQLFGARMTFCDVADYATVDTLMGRRAAEISAAGGRASVIPLGGATALGTIGYVLAAQEIFAQLDVMTDAPGVIVLAGGTGSTAAGLALGAGIWRPSTRIIVISASWSEARLCSEIHRHMEEATTLLGIAPPPLPELTVDDTQVGTGYTRVTPAALSAMHSLARGDGVLLDMTYTAKAMAGCISLAERGAISANSSIVFVHTGGTSEIFARPDGDFAA